MKYLSAALAPALLFPAIAQAQSVFDLGEVVFSAGLTEQDAARVGVSVDVITEDDLRAAGDVPLAEFLATLPGVTVTRNGPPGSTATVRIRGAGQGLIAVFIDGIAVNDPTGTNGQFGGFGGLTTGALRRVEVLRGSQSAVYGSSAVAGVISISTVATGAEPEGTTQSARVEAGSYGTFSADYGLIQRQGPLTLSFGLTHWQSRGFSAAEENLGNTEADPSKSSRISLGAIYDVSPNVTIGANAFVQKAEAEFDEFVGAGPADGTPGDETGGDDSFGLRVFGEYRTANWAHNLSGTYLNLERRLSSVTVADQYASPFSSTFNGERRTLQYLATTDSVANTNLSFGLDWQEERGRFTGLIGGARTISMRV
jgi:vitamin B12 transporter